MQIIIKRAIILVHTINIQKSNCTYKRTAIGIVINIVPNKYGRAGKEMAFDSANGHISILKQKTLLRMMMLSMLAKTEKTFPIIIENLIYVTKLIF